MYNVAHFLTTQADQAPEASAVKLDWVRSGWRPARSIHKSFLELDLAASAVADRLEARGVSRGMRVLMLVKPGFDLICVVFALFKLGAIPIVVDPGMGLKKFLRCVRGAGPQALVGIPMALILARLFPRSFAEVQIRTGVRSLVSAVDLGCVRPSRRPAVPVEADELAAILFTSGSTGPAKGVHYTHGMMSAQVAMIRQQYGIKPGEVDLPMLPVFALFNPALGMCTVVPDMNPSRPACVDPKRIIAAIQAQQVSNSFGSPAIWSQLARYCLQHQIQLPSVRRILMAGAPVSSELMAQMQAIVPNGCIHTPYGATEVLPVSSITAQEVLAETAAATRAGKGTCVGKPLAGVEIVIIAAQDSPIEQLQLARQLPIGEVGEIVVTGPSVTRSYDRLPAADAAAKIQDSGRVWHRMGDLGYLDVDGRLWFCGRKAECVQRAEDILYTDCCEAIFNQHPSVHRSALIDVGAGQAGVVIEPEAGEFPRTAAKRAAFIAELEALAEPHPHLRQPLRFFSSSASQSL
jgi:acyl-CoA synthetase (AMP-forming)/AMP-acid ligase II